MTVAELTVKLRNVPQDMDVAVSINIESTKVAEAIGAWVEEFPDGRKRFCIASDTVDWATDDLFEEENDAA